MSVSYGAAPTIYSGAPVFVANHLLDGISLTAAKWTADGNQGSASITATDYLARWAHDRRQNKVTMPSSAPGTTHYFNTNGIGATDDLNVVGILNHNLGDKTTPQIVVQTAEDDAFTTPIDILTIGSGTLVQTHRVVQLLGNEWTGLTRIRLKITAGAAFTPEFGELWLGSLRALEHGPLEPFDDGGEESNVVDVDPTGGHMVRVKRHSRRRDMSDLRFHLDTDTAVAVIRGVWTDSDGCTLPFLVCLDSDDAQTPAKWHLVYGPSRLNLPLARGPSLRDVAFPCIEIAPFAGAE